MSDTACCHIFNGIWNDGVIHTFNIMDRQSNEFKEEEKMLKELTMGTESGNSHLSLAVIEYK